MGTEGKDTEESETDFPVASSENCQPDF